MRLLELFSGTASISNVFKEKGYETYTIDSDFGFNPDLCIDILAFEISMLDGFQPDIVWASPPCQAFSVATIGRNWHKDYSPKTDKARQSIAIVLTTLDIITNIHPKLWFIENPVGMLRKLDFMRCVPRKTVTYCQYGDMRMKPTDIWSNAYNLWHPRPMCKAGDSCHEPAPRGSKTGTQGLRDTISRSKIPYELCVEIMQACEKICWGE